MNLVREGEGGRETLGHTDRHGLSVYVASTAIHTGLGGFSQSLCVVVPVFLSCSRNYVVFRILAKLIIVRTASSLALGLSLRGLARRRYQCSCDTIPLILLTFTTRTTTMILICFLLLLPHCRSQQSKVPSKQLTDGCGATTRRDALNSPVTKRT